MTRYAAVLILFLLALGNLGALETEIFGDVFGDAGAALLRTLKEENRKQGLYRWDDMDVFPVIQVVEQGKGYAADDALITFTVSLGFSEDDDPPEKLPFGTFCMYAPLKTIIVELNEKADQQSLAKAIKQIRSVADQLSREFLPLYAEGHKVSREYRLMAELRNYGTMAIQWLKTPVSQGGAGGDASTFTISDLAYFLGFDGGTYILNTDYAEYRVLALDARQAVIGAYPGEYWEGDQPLYRAVVRFDTGDVRILRRGEGH